MSITSKVHVVAGTNYRHSCPVCNLRLQSNNILLT